MPLLVKRLYGYMYVYTYWPLYVMYCVEIVLQVQCVLHLRHLQCTYVFLQHVYLKYMTNVY